MNPHFSLPCDHSCVKNGRLLRFPKIFIKRQTRWSNDKTIILLNMVIAKYRDLSVSRRTIICRSRKICSPLKNQDILLHLVINLKTIEHWLWASKMWDRLVLWEAGIQAFFKRCLCPYTLLIGTGLPDLTEDTRWVCSHSSTRRKRGQNTFNDTI